MNSKVTVTVAAKKAIVPMTPSVPSPIRDNQIIKAKENGKAKERGVVEVAEATGEAGVVEEKGKEVTVREAAGPGSRKAIATAVRFINTHVSLDAQMCVVDAVTRERAH